MKNRTSSSNKSLILFLFIIFTLGILFGIMIFFIQNDVIKDMVFNELNLFSELIKTTKQNQIIFHLVVVLIIFVLNFTIIGTIISIGYLFYEGCSIGFSIAVLTMKYKTSGFIFSLIFNVLTKFIYIIIIIYICFIGIKIAKKMIRMFIYKSNELSYKYIIKNFKILIISLVIIFINEIIIYYFGNKILEFFLFLLN